MEHPINPHHIMFMNGTCVELDELPTPSPSPTTQITKFTFTHDINVAKAIHCNTPKNVTLL